MAVSKAVKLLDRLLEAGYPEGTAKKIASGELPMDFNSRMNRAREQGFTTEAYHTGDPNVLEFNPDAGFGDRHGGGTWFSQEPEISASYTAPESAGYRALLDTRNFAQVDAGGANWNDLPYETNMYIPKGERFPEGKDYALEELEYILQENVIDTTDKVARAARDMGASGVEIAQVHDLGGNYPAMKKVIEGMNPNIDRQDWINDYELSGGTNYSVQDPSKIRSYYGAAFDPDNKGLANILGGSAALAVGLGASNESEAAQMPRVSPQFASRMFDEIVAENTGREKNAYVPVRPTTMDYVKNAGQAVMNYFGTDQGKDMLGGLGQEIAVEGALGSLGQMIFGPAGAVGGAAFLPNVAGDPTMDMLNDQGQPMTEAEFAAYRRQLRGNQ